jgi:pimeloyl-ACP methyl ester carboxylesterase
MPFRGFFFSRVRLPLTALFLLGISLRSAEATWSPAEQSRLEALAARAPEFPSGNAATVWGGVQKALWLARANLPQTERTWVQLPHTHQAPLPVVLLPGRNRAPLRVFLTGLFGNLNDSVAASHIAWLRETGSHVLALPNPWSTDWQASKPLALPGEVAREAESVLALVRWAIQKLGPETVGEVHLLGVSYGAFLATAVAAIDAQAPSPVITGKVTAFSPPSSLIEASAAFDEGFLAIDRDSVCAKPLPLGFLLDFAWATNTRGLKPLTRHCADPLLFGSFHMGLIDLGMALDRRLELGKVPHPQREARKFREWKRTFTLSALLQDFILRGQDPPPELLENAFLQTWLAKLSPEAALRYRILIAKDDFLSQHTDWSALLRSQEVPAASSFELPWGGHYGYSGAPEFIRFLKEL